MTATDQIGSLGGAALAALVAVLLIAAVTIYPDVTKDTAAVDATAAAAAAHPTPTDLLGVAQIAQAAVLEAHPRTVVASSCAFGGQKAAGWTYACGVTLVSPAGRQHTFAQAVVCADPPPGLVPVGCKAS